MSCAIEPPDKLLDLIYDAASEQTLWPSVLTGIADLTNSAGGVLYGQSVSASKVYFRHNGRLSEDCHRAYAKRHMQNPWTLAMEMQPVGHILFSDEVLPLATLRTTGFFADVLRPQGLAHNAMIPLAAQNGFRAAFNLLRTPQQGPFGQDERLVLGRLVPHLRRSIRLGFRIEAYRALHDAAYQALDRISVAVILLDQRSRILYANAAAQALERSGGTLNLRSGAVMSSSPAHSRRLSELIRLALRGEPANSMSMPQASDGHLLTVLVSSIRGQDVGRFTDLNMPDAAAALFITDPANRAGIPIAWIQDAYGLTPVEAKVALAAATGLTIPEASVRLGLSPNTIKTHLRKIFAKTDTHRQVDLAALINALGLLRRDDAAMPN